MCTDSPKPTIALVGTVSSSIFGFRRPLLELLVSKGYEVYVFVADLSEEAKLRARKELGVTAEKYDLARTGINPFADLKSAWLLAARLKEIKPDVLFCYFAKPVIWGTLAGVCARVRSRYGMLEGLGYFFTVDPGNDTLKKKLIRYVQVCLFHVSVPFLKGLIVLNVDDKRELVDYYRVRAKEVFVLGGIGLDLGDFPYMPMPSASISFIFIGRLLKEKGINEFLDAAVHLKSKYPNLEFKVLGDVDVGNPGSVDKGRLNDLVSKKVIIYPGVVSDVAGWIASSSVFVLPSYREGFPRSTQEAMAVGRAVVTTDVPGCRETVCDGVNGFIVSPHNWSELSAAMERFVKNPALIEVMGRNSRAIAEQRFDASLISARLVGFLGL